MLVCVQVTAIAAEHNADTETMGGVSYVHLFFCVAIVIQKSGLGCPLYCLLGIFGRTNSVPARGYVQFARDITVSVQGVSISRAGDGCALMKSS